MLKLFLCFRKMNSKNNLANSRIILLKSRKKKLILKQRLIIC